MFKSIREKSELLRLIAIDLTNCEYYGEDDAVLGNLAPADIVNAIDNLTDSIRREIVDIENKYNEIYSTELKTCIKSIIDVNDQVDFVGKRGVISKLANRALTIIF